MLKPVLLLVGTWVAGLLLVLAGMLMVSNLRYVEGEIVLEESPFCQFFVVKTSAGFTLASTEREDVALLGGYKAAGPLHRPGDVVLDIEANGRVRARVERAKVDQEEAIAEFERRCPDAALPLVVLRPKTM